MHTRLNHSPFRFAVAVVAAIIIGQRAAAQTDPFVLMRGGAGDQIMDQNGSDRGITMGPSTWGFVSGDSNWLYRYFGPPGTLYVPPLPAVLGEELPGAGGMGFGSRFATGVDHETFSTAWTILDRYDALPSADAARVAAYQTSRQQLVKEVRVKFEELAGATPAVRMAGLSELAVQQAGRLRALASEEEAIRKDLAWVGSKFGYYLAFRLSGPAAEMPRLLFAACFNDGLSTEQRLLLPEIAFGKPSVPGNEGPGKPVAGGDVFFFLPATVRIRLPAGLPPALEAKIHEFVLEKESLKSELRNAVLLDNYFFISTHTRRLAALAAQQAPRFAALEALAEEIRVGLTGLGFPKPPGTLELPADLTQRVGSFYARKVQVRRELLSRLRTLRNQYPTVRFDIARQGDGLTIVQSGGDPAIAASLTAFNSSQAGVYTAFTSESEVLRRDVQHYLESNPRQETRTVDQLAADFARAYATRENGDRYRDYVRAVLEPGLAPAQRRLLFQSATAPLDQSGGSSQP